MFPKSDASQASLVSLDLWAEFRNENVVAALTLGLRLERAIAYNIVESLLAVVRTRGASGGSISSNAMLADESISNLKSSSANSRLQASSMEQCSSIMVSPPGTYGIDRDKFMLSAHTPDFTDRRLTTAIGKSLRAAAREGLRSPVGDWGELRDDPFAAPGKKVALVFKPDVFSYLGLHRNNPYGIKTTLFSIDL